MAGLLQLNHTSPAALRAEQFSGSGCGRDSRLPAESGLLRGHWRLGADDSIGGAVQRDRCNAGVKMGQLKSP